ncbi:MAG: type III-A CRISPR-associated RAMP protein Csm3 [Flammeovirgaceae bacterium]
MPQLIKKIMIEGQIIAKSGIMVGGSNSALEIGGTDKQVVRNPVTNLPYIPGSTLKGKMRSLFELVNGTISEDDRRGTYGPTHKTDALAAQIFGYIKHDDNNKESQQPSRLIVRDAELMNPEDIKGTELPYSEVKAENSIDRITAEANPRFFERVPKGARFKLSLVLNVFDNDKNGASFLKHIYNALRLVEDDYLGGAGSRGNGQVMVVLDSVKERNTTFYVGDGAEVTLPIPEDFQSAKLVS